MQYLKNNKGEYINCAFHKAIKGGINVKTRRTKCLVLYHWYNDDGAPWERCKGCPFFKTAKQLEEEDKRDNKRLSALGKPERTSRDKDENIE